MRPRCISDIVALRRDLILLKREDLKSFVNSAWGCLTLAVYRGFLSLIYYLSSKLVSCGGV